MARNRNTRDAERIQECQDLAAAMALHGANLPQLATAQADMGKLLTEIQDLTTQRSVHQSNKQAVSQQIRTRIDECTKIATVIRVTLRQHFGTRSEELVKFGLQPFRGRKPVPPENPPAPEDPAAKTPGTPASPATK